MATFSDVLNALGEMSPLESKLKFEHVMVGFFKTDPVLQKHYDEVYHWSDWKYNGGRADAGIDLVARNREDKTWTAVQVKFYAPHTYLQKSALDSFFTESGKKFTTEKGEETFSNRLIVTTTMNLSANATDAIENQSIPTQLIGPGTIAASPINWDIAWPNNEFQVDLSPQKKFEPRAHQRQAIDAVLSGFETHDRGKMIMACGTGKTFTALRLAEELAEHNGGRARILFAVPSIALLGQSLREWSAQANLDLRAFAVCSDKKVSKEAEDIKSYELEIPVTTDGKYLAARILAGPRRAKGLEVVFTTYQSIEAVHDAQQQGVPDFDLIICDEAHRTTGVTMAGEEPSAFTRVHDAQYIRSARRLYMTATPRLYDDKIKDKATDHSAEIASMDDEALYGPEFHKIGFGEAVEKGLLTDYKVLVMAVDEDSATDTVRRATPLTDGELRLDTVSQLIGVWTALAKRTHKDSQDFVDSAPMQRAVAFARDIRTSKNIAEITPMVVSQYRQVVAEKAAVGEVSDRNLDLELAVKHVDGTMSADTRLTKLNWLEQPLPQDKTHILTNARCLSEGVDVPALDAVVFLNPRNSIVDVVQSVGRVMRKSEGKDYGYIILPVAVPPGKKPSEVLNDSQRFKVVWQVLNALRAHDERLKAIVNSAVLNKTDTHEEPSALEEKVNVDLVSPAELTEQEREDATKQMALFSLDEFQEAMYTKIVDKVGDREYWEDWASDVADIAQAQISRITNLLDNADEHVTAEFERFIEGLRGNLNDSITRNEAISMLSQHLITAPVFDALFADQNFAEQNPVSKVMQRMVDALDDKKLEDETSGLERFYDSVRIRASEVTSAEGKQTVIKDLYERFFKTAFRRQSEALGIVYTPVEIVDFILRAADDVSRKHFGRGLTDENVHVLDPFTGTGTFMVRLLQSGLIEPKDLARKYASELHATEIMLLAYYVAAVNIETTYNALMTERARLTGDDEPDYAPFEGIALADTFQISEDDDTLDLEVFKQNHARIQRQLDAPIHVIVGNPPYSVGQTSANDLNANLKYPTLDARIAETYVAKSTATNKNSLYDSYFRAFRWATDRIGDRGVVAFVTNNGWIDGNTGDGVRLSFAEDFSDLYIFNLRGNSRTAGESAKREGGNVFNVRVGTQIFVGVKAPGSDGPRIHYRDIGDYLTAEEKLRIVDKATIENISWSPIEPNEYGDWVSQRSPEFETWPVLGDKRDSSVPHVFENFSAGLKTARDAWCYGFTASEVMEKMEVLVDTYQDASKAFAEWQQKTGRTATNEAEANAFLRENPVFADTTKISWDANLKASLARGDQIEFRNESVTQSLYRPFVNQAVYTHRLLNQRVYQLPSMFPTPKHDNIGFMVTGPALVFQYGVVATNLLPNLHLLTGGQFFPRWTWEPVEAPEGELDFGVGNEASISKPGEEGEVLDGYHRVDNVTDEILGIYRDALGGGGGIQE